LVKDIGRMIEMGFYVINCKECGEECSRVDTVYCAKCGSPIDAAKVCGCGREFARLDKFCENCGQPRKMYTWEKE